MFQSVFVFTLVLGLASSMVVPPSHPILHPDRGHPILKKTPPPTMLKSSAGNVTAPLTMDPSCFAILEMLPLSGNQQAFGAGIFGDVGNVDYCQLLQGHTCGVYLEFMCVEDGPNGTIGKQYIVPKNAMWCTQVLYPATGVCAPTTCKSQDIATFANQYVYGPGTEGGQKAQPAWKSACQAASLSQCNLTKSYFVLNVKCEDEEESMWNKSDSVAVFSVFISLLGLTVLSTLIAAAYRWKRLQLKKRMSLLPTTHHDAQLQLFSALEEQNGEEGYDVSHLEKSASYFDAYSAIQTLFSHRPIPTNFLNGIRSISMFWVIFGHSVFFPLLAPGAFSNQSNYLMNWLGTARSLFLFSAYYAVDTFFFISGFLFTYLYIKKAPPLKAIPMMYLHRVLRLTPCMAMVMLLTWKVVPYMASGPFAISLRDNPEFPGNCDETWFDVLSFVSSLLPQKAEHINRVSCMGWYWFLSVDMVYFVISPWILFLIVHPNFNVRGVGWGVLISTHITCIVLASTNHVMSTPINMVHYMRPYFRASPYIFGIYAGWILHREDAKAWFAANLIRRMSLYTVAAACLTLCGWYSWNQSYRGYAKIDVLSGELNKLENFVYFFCWGGGLSLITILWSTDEDRNNAISAFLSHPVWTVLGKLSFGAYLIHPSVIVVSIANDWNLPTFTSAWLIVHFSAFLVLSYLCSLILYLTLERPMEKLNELLTSSSSKKHK
eukprot:PhF_6_TR26106/c0_g1_i1/m.36913